MAESKYRTNIYIDSLAGTAFPNSSRFQSHNKKKQHFSFREENKFKTD